LIYWGAGEVKRGMKRWVKIGMVFMAKTGSCDSWVLSVRNLRFLPVRKYLWRLLSVSIVSAGLVLSMIQRRAFQKSAIFCLFHRSWPDLLAMATVSSILLEKYWKPYICHCSIYGICRFPFFENLGEKFFSLLDFFRYITRQNRHGLGLYALLHLVSLVGFWVIFV